MNQDSAFAIGKTHEVCQDYARSGRILDVSYALVCDGCSSSPDSDLGARLLALAAEEVLLDCVNSLPFLSSFQRDIEKIGEDAERRARRRLEEMGLPETCLDATLLMALSDGKDALLSAFGDGVMALVKPGSVVIHEVSYPSGYPCYLSYRGNPERQARFAEVGGPGRVTRTVWGIGGRQQEEKRVEPHKAVSVLEKGTDATMCAVMSDGALSFVGPDRQPVPVDEVMAKLLSFKGSQGRFVQRRMNAFKKAAAKEGWEHNDDLSLAAVHVSHAPGGGRP